MISKEKGSLSFKQWGLFIKETPYNRNCQAIKYETDRITKYTKHVLICNNKDYFMILETDKE